MPRSKTRTQSCDRSDALNRLAQAESCLDAAGLMVDDDSVDDDSVEATPRVAASLAVLCGRLAVRPGVRLRGRSEPHGGLDLHRREPALDRRPTGHDRRTGMVTTLVGLPSRADGSNTVSSPVPAWAEPNRAVTSKVPRVPVPDVAMAGSS